MYCSSCFLHGSFECTKSYLVSCQIIMEYSEFEVTHKGHPAPGPAQDNHKNYFLLYPKDNFFFFSASLLFLTFEGVLIIGLASIGLDKKKKGKNKRYAARAAVNSHFCSSHRSMAVCCASWFVSSSSPLYKLPTLCCHSPPVRKQRRQKIFLLWRRSGKSVCICV